MASTTGRASTARWEPSVRDHSSFPKRRNGVSMILSGYIPSGTAARAAVITMMAMLFWVLAVTSAWSAGDCLSSTGEAAVTVRLRQPWLNGRSGAATVR